jgi:L-fuconolactonase
MEQFKAERVMFGSDWPVCLLATSYEQVYSVIRSLGASRLGTGAFETVFGKNAARLYRLD